MFRSSLPKIILIALLTLAATGCNTIQGIGRDVQKGGEAIERVGR